MFIWKRGNAHQQVSGHAVASITRLRKSRIFASRDLLSNTDPPDRGPAGLDERFRR